MREIKFRGKRVDNGEWVTGFYVYMGVSRRGTSHLEFAHMILDSSSKDAEGLVQYEVIPETIGQFTGIHDKNDVEIYDGDIVYIKGEDDKGTIVWDSEELEYGIDMEGVQVKLGCFYGRDLEVIGNIHDKES